MDQDRLFILSGIVTNTAISLQIVKHLYNWTDNVDFTQVHAQQRAPQLRLLQLVHKLTLYFFKKVSQTHILLLF